MTNGNERFDRIERILERVAHSLQEVAPRQQEMAARQQYHDGAFERHDSEMKTIRDAISIDAENIRALVRVAELHHRRLTDSEGGEAN